MPGGERHLRGRPVLDRIMYSVSESANHSKLWHTLGAVQAAVRRDRRPSSELSAALLAEAVLVNGVIKTVVGRRRPPSRGARPHHLRQPLTSSFPSGHASAAMVAAALLARRSRWAPAYYRAGAGGGAEPHPRAHPPRQRRGRRDRCRRGPRRSGPAACCAETPPGRASLGSARGARRGGRGGHRGGERHRALAGQGAGTRRRLGRGGGRHRRIRRRPGRGRRSRPKRGPTAGSGSGPGST